MTNPITKEIDELIKGLGEEIKKSETFTEYQKAIEAYTHSDKLNQLVFEYNVQQNVLAEAYKNGKPEQDFVDSVNKRLNDLYEEIQSNEDYKSFLSAQENYEKYMQSIYSELDYRITGKRACSHDCSTCAGCGETK